MLLIHSIKILKEISTRIMWISPFYLDTLTFFVYLSKIKRPAFILNYIFLMFKYYEKFDIILYVIIIWILQIYHLFF